MTGDFLDMSMGAAQEAITLTGNSTSNVQHCTIACGSSTAISIASGSSQQLHCVLISSSNGSPITGSGSLVYTDVVYNSVFGIGSSTVLSPFPSTSAWKFIQQQTAANVASIVFSRGITVQHNNYMVMCYNVVPVTDDVNFFMDVSTDGGSTWLNTGYNSYALLQTQGGNGETTNATTFQLTVDRDWETL